MVYCESQSVKQVLEIPTRRPFRHRGGQISDVIRLRVSIYFNLSFVNIKYLFIVATCGQDNLSINSRFTYIQCIL